MLTHIGKYFFFRWFARWEECIKNAGYNMLLNSNASAEAVITIIKTGTKLHFKSPTAERRHVLCVGVGGDRTHASCPGGAGYAPFAN